MWATSLCFATQSTFRIVLFSSNVAQALLTSTKVARRHPCLTTHGLEVHLLDYVKGNYKGQTKMDKQRQNCKFSPIFAEAAAFTENHRNLQKPVSHLAEFLPIVGWCTVQHHLLNMFWRTLTPLIEGAASDQKNVTCETTLMNKFLGGAAFSRRF